jgi:SAM-dependent methyltransferase
MQLPKTKILDMEDLKDPTFAAVNNMYDEYFGPNWPEVPLRRWEYVAAIVFSEIMAKPGLCLDAGCGSNVFSKFLNKIGCDVYCIDIGLNERMVDGISYYNMSMHDMNRIEDNTFRYVFAISSIEHVNAGRFKIEGMDFDTGDTQAMKELVRVLRPGGKLILTTDYADKYYPPPGLWPSGSHRIYDFNSITDRLLKPISDNTLFKEGIRDFGNGSFIPEDLRAVEPKGYDYTEIILTLEKC